MDLLYLNISFDGKSIPLFINKSKTVKDLYDAVRSKIGGGPNLDFYLIAIKDGDNAPTILDENSSASLESLKLAKRADLDLCIRAPGGIRELTPLPGYIEVTTSPCDFSLDDNPSIARAKMPCGCVIDPEMLKFLCDTSIKDGNYAFSCPNCKVSWQFQWVRHVLSATMTEEEIEELISKLNDNFIAKQLQIKKCPTCKNFLERNRKGNFLNWNWVRCPLCTSRSGRNVEFCWICLKPWIGNRAWCGNGGCDGIADEIQFLQTCETKTIGKVEGVPSVRGCVECGKLINHAEKCKHMACKCGYSFCFVCLKPYLKSSGKWQCGEAYDPCPVAPRQVDFAAIK